MKKTRSAPIESGDTAMTYASLFGTYNSNLNVVPDWETEEKLLALYQEGLFHALFIAPVTIIPPSYIGTELFASTGYRRPRFNNVVHQKLSAFDYPLALNARRLLSIYGDYAKFRRSSYWPSTGVTGINASDDLSQYEGAARRAWWTMQPRFEGEISMLNFLYELKDFRSLAKALWKYDHVKLADRLSRLRRSFRGGLRKYMQNPTLKTSAVLSLKTGSWSTDVLARFRLLKEFAVDPLISDLCVLHQQLGTIVRDAQQDFFERGEKTQARHYSEEFVLQDSLVNETGNSWYFAKGFFKSTVFTATMEYRYHYDMRSEFDAFMKYWGLVPSLETFWNGTPFTFLFDYFIKVGNAIHTMSVDPRVSLQKVQYCESFLTRHISGRCTSGAAEFPPYPGRNVLLCVNGKCTKGRRGVPISGYKGTTYVRNVKEPNKGSALPRLSFPSTGQTLNILALVRCFL